MLYSLMMCQTKNFFLLFFSSFLSPSSLFLSQLSNSLIAFTLHLSSVCLSLLLVLSLWVWNESRQAHHHKPKPECFILETMSKSSQWFQRCCSTNTTGRLCNWGMASISNRYFPGFFYCVFCRVFCFHAVVSGHTSGSWCEKTSRPGWWLTSRWFIFGCTDVMKPQQ